MLDDIAGVQPLHYACMYYVEGQQTQVHRNDQQITDIKWLCGEQSLNELQ